MAPMFRTCCGFLQIHAACKVGNPRLCIKTGLNAGPKCLYRLPAIQVRESSQSHILRPGKLFFTGQVKNDLFTISLYHLRYHMYHLRHCIKLYMSLIT